MQLHVESNCRIEGEGEIWIDAACQLEDMEDSSISSQHAQGVTPTNYHRKVDPTYCDTLIYFIPGVTMSIFGLLSCVFFIIHGMVLKLYVREFAAAGVVYTLGGISAMALFRHRTSKWWRIYLIVVAVAVAAFGMTQVVLRIDGIRNAIFIVNTKHLKQTYYDAGSTALVISALFLIMGIISVCFGVLLVVHISRRSMKNRPREVPSKTHTEKVSEKRHYYV